MDDGVAPHGLRRSFAGDVYAATGHDVRKVQHLLGHSSPLITAQYLRREQDQLDEIVRGLPFRGGAGGLIRSATADDGGDVGKDSAQVRGC